MGRLPYLRAFALAAALFLYLALPAAPGGASAAAALGAPQLRPVDAPATVAAAASPYNFTPAEQRAIAAENRVIELGVENTNLKDEVAALKAKLSEAQINVG